VHIKAAGKMLVKSTPGVNFTNILRAAYMLIDLKSMKIQLSHQYLFTLFGSVCVKAARKMLVKSSPYVAAWFFIFELVLWASADFFLGEGKNILFAKKKTT